MWQVSSNIKEPTFLFALITPLNLFLRFLPVAHCASCPNAHMQLRDPLRAATLMQRVGARIYLSSHKSEAILQLYK